MKWKIFSFFCLCTLNLGFTKNYTRSYELEVGEHRAKFQIHFSKKQSPKAEEVISIIRRDISRVIQFFDYAPISTTHFVFDENPPLANGSAAVAPYNKVILFDRPPETGGALSGSLDWFRILVVHEFIHILTLEMTTSWLRWLRYIFGSSVKFAGLVPRWFAEGIATWGESYFTDSGRIRDFNYRASLLEFLKKPKGCKKLSCLDDPGHLPGGGTAYLLGGYFFDYLHKKNEKGISCLFKRNSHSLPFRVGSHFQKCFGAGATSLFDEFRKSFKSEFKGHSIKFHFKLPRRIGSKSYSVKNANSILEFKEHAVFLAQIENEEFLIVYDRKKKRVRKKRLIDTTVRLEKIGKSNTFQLVSLNRNYEGKRRDYSIYNFKLRELITDQSDALYHYRINKARYEFRYKGSYLSIWKKSENRPFEKMEELGKMQIKDPIVHGKKIFFISGHKDQIHHTGTVLSVDLSTGSLWKHLELSKSAELRKCHIPVLVENDGLSFLIPYGEMVETKLTDRKSVQGPVCLKWNKEERFIPNRVASTRLRINEKDIKHEVSKKSSSYNPLKYLYPTFLNLGLSANGDLSIYNFGTVLSDPLNKITLGLGGLYYPEIQKVSPDISLLVDLPKSLILSMGYYKFFGRFSFSKEEFKTGGPWSRLTYQKNIGKTQWTPFLSASNFDKVDIVGAREELSFGGGLNFTKRFQSFHFPSMSLGTSYTHHNIKDGVSFGEIGAFAGLGIKATSNLSILLDASYRKYQKENFEGGVLFGGGVNSSGIVNTAYPDQSYYFNFGDILGNEITSVRADMEYRLFRPHWGAKNSPFIPFFLRNIGLRGGLEFFQADRFFITEDKLVADESLLVPYFGVGAGINLLYFLPLKWELIAAMPIHDEADGSSFRFNISVENFLIP